LNPGRISRVYLAVAACAIAVYLGALSNGFSLDDVPIIATNPLVHRWSALWQVFTQPYWPASTGAAMYRPVTLATYALDWQVGRVAWLHAMNVLWHAGASVAVAAMARRWSGSAGGALVAGILFAVHPVHVEAVANIVGRAEMMATLGVIVSVYAALERDDLWLSLGAFALGLLSKETAATAPALIAAAWFAGVGSRSRLPQGRMLAYVAGWIAVGTAYWAVRWGVLHAAPQQMQAAPVFAGASFPAVRLTAVAAFADFARLLVLPVTLRVDYSPGERTLVTTPLDARFLLGALCFMAWAALLVWSWRRDRRLEAYGLCWIAIALLPVANLLFPVGVLVAERTLYLPSVGLALIAGAWLRRLPPRRLAIAATAVFLIGGARTALRVPVWANSDSVLRSVSRDSPRSYVAPTWMAAAALAQRQPERALQAVRTAASITDGAPKMLLLGADAAFALGRPQLADSFLAQIDRLCSSCPFYYEFEARAALSRGDTAVADSFLVRVRRR
jgi:protein O-mannosyl-transferase